jgi:hypothetical protein
MFIVFNSIIELATDLWCVNTSLANCWSSSFCVQEFDSREAAEESVAKYHEGYFMGNKIRVELSHGGGRTAKFAGDPGACFKCAQMGHWARFELFLPRVHCI